MIKIRHKWFPYDVKEPNEIIEYRIFLTIYGWKSNTNDFKNYNIKIQYFYWVTQLWNKYIRNKLKKKKQENLVKSMECLTDKYKNSIIL